MSGSFQEFASVHQLVHHGHKFTKQLHLGGQDSEESDGLQLPGGFPGVSAAAALANLDRVAHRSHQ